MKVVFDSHIPFLTEAVRNGWPQVEICPMEPEQIDASAVRDADVLVVRTRTQVNKTLLAGSKVLLVCTATIGYDHIDTAWCKSQGIRWTACPGCNAQAVCDYVEEAIKEVYYDPFCIFGERSAIGIIGVGHVGSLVAEMAKRNGFDVWLYDPPKGIGHSLDFIAANSDIITFHVPLTHTGLYPTYHMCDEAFLKRCAPSALIINASRGGVVDEQALLRSGHPYIIDTWENEPDINPQALQHAQRASMHIAGYSVQGKRNAAQMCLDAIAEQFGLKPVKLSTINFQLSTSGDSAPGWLSRISDSLKAHPDEFEALRKSYPLRGV